MDNGAIKTDQQYIFNIYWITMKAKMTFPSISVSTCSHTYLLHNVAFENLSS